jgi:murein L,D-transpeptidase YafK
LLNSRNYFLLRGAALTLAALISSYADAQTTSMSTVTPSTMLPNKASASVNETPAFDNPIEAALARTLDAWAQGGIKQAISELDATLAKTPNFRLGHLLRGDLLMAKAGKPISFESSFGKNPNNPNAANAESLKDLRDEARVRIERLYNAQSRQFLPIQLLQMAPQQEHVLLMDGEKSRLYVFKNEAGTPQYVTDFYVSVGKKGIDKSREGDQRTPLGVYNIVSSIAREKLTDLYGPGAFPINFPNEWDKRTGRSGSGIWIHGTPSNTYNRAPKSSDGCVVLTNDDFAKISQFIEIGSTPVVIAPQLDWLPPAQWQANRQDFIATFDKWKQDWESLQIENYLAHYSPNFNADGKDYAAWVSHKRNVNALKTFVKLELRNLSIYVYPQAEIKPQVASAGRLPTIEPVSTQMMMVTFDQDYRSSNNSSKMRKRQYWVSENGHWRILSEAQATD